MFELLPTLVFGAIAVFFAIRVYSALGRREGHMEPPPSHEQGGAKSAAASGAVHLRPAFEGPAAAGLEAIAAADPGFEPERFVEGARMAYTMIVEAFARGEKDALRSLLSTQVYDRYAEAIDGRVTRQEQVKTEIERIASAEIAEASHEDGLARVKVRFRAEIATETLDEKGERIAGDFSQLSTVRENWIFERRTDNSDPNWVLSGVATA
jgi:predicted lipid-binding transport protein (Tim44 family)